MFCQGNREYSKLDKRKHFLAMKLLDAIMNSSRVVVCLFGSRPGRAVSCLLEAGTIFAV